MWGILRRWKLLAWEIENCGDGREVSERRLLGCWLRQMMGCQAFQEEKKFRRTDFGEEFALNSLLNGSHLHGVGRAFSSGHHECVWPGPKLQQKETTRMYPAKGSHLQTVAPTQAVSSVARGRPPISQLRAGEGPSLGRSQPPTGGDSCWQLSARHMGKEAVLILLQPTVTPRNGRAVSYSAGAPVTHHGLRSDHTGQRGWVRFLTFQRPSPHPLSELAEPIVDTPSTSCTATSAWNY